MGACGSKKDEETVIVYDERDRPRRVSVTEYGQINDAHQRKLNNMGYDNAARRLIRTCSGAGFATRSGWNPSRSTWWTIARTGRS